MNGIEYRLTASDETRITTALGAIWREYRPKPALDGATVDTLTRIAAHAIGCTTADLRESELDWIRDEITVLPFSDRAR